MRALLRLAQRARPLLRARSAAHLADAKRPELLGDWIAPQVSKAHVAGTGGAGARQQVAGGGVAWWAEEGQRRRGKVRRREGSRGWEERVRRKC